MGILGPKHHTQKIGDISESAVITRLLRCGYIVLMPYGQNHRYDLVIEDADNKFWRVQVKTEWLNEGNYSGKGSVGACECFRPWSLFTLIFRGERRVCPSRAGTRHSPYGIFP